jgi:flagellar motor switch protein FliN/FliY
MSDEKNINPPQENSPPAPDDLTQTPSEAPKEESEDAMLKMLDELPKEGAGSKAEDIQFDSASVANAEFQQLTQAAPTGKTSSIDLLLDVSLPVSIELGQTQLTISDILALGPGSVVELARLAGEPVDVMVNHKLVARGEVVVVDENFGVRVTQLITPQERLRLLGEA